jgi:hypothetical protein
MPQLSQNISVGEPVLADEVLPKILKSAFDIAGEAG